MNSFRPYMIRALYEWIADNEMTPHLVADGTAAGLEVPPAAVADGRVVLNISMSAVRDLTLGDEYIHFSARFGGKPFQVVVPTAAVIGMFAREDGRLIMLPEDDVKHDDFEDGETDVQITESAPRSHLSSVAEPEENAQDQDCSSASKDDKSDDSGPDDDGPDSNGAKKKPSLRVVK